MNILLVLLRLIHIVSAFAWVGLGVTFALYVGPAAGAAGESGFRFLKSLLTRTSYAKVFPAAAGITMLAGILLYITGSANNFSTLGNISLGIGALAGIAAGIHGGAVTGRATGEFAQALAQNVSDNGQAISPDAVTTLRSLAMQVAGHARLSLILMIIALIGMASARYL